ncbi:hypothetical protein GIB67_033278 [Kingdonia uniflora]|uniref:Membrane protein of ER body-like protein n=1 Tax=Kingdonia uniflora TaxID=39325 RepID=A0A7J7MPE3_9MAGN|nr:hypothetical protein GIB67_033278 [Kingdonia uniflora]
MEMEMEREVIPFTTDTTITTSSSVAVSTTTTASTIREKHLDENSQLNSSDSKGEASSSSVYLDTNNGAESSNGTGWTKFNAIDSSIPETTTGNGKPEFTLNNCDNQWSLISHQGHEILKEGQQFSLHLLHSEKPSENEITSFKPVEKNAYVITEIENTHEVAEWNVEKVLQEQETHDLYCPNCNSCITKRVTLRKRKRKVQNVQSDTKREKIETIVQSGVVNGPPDIAPSEYPSQIETDGREPETGPDVFRCLSCFSFFIPTVSGFKLSRIFRGKGGGENVQSPQDIPPMAGTGQLGPNVIDTQEIDHSTTLFPGKTTVTIGSPGEDENMKIQIDTQNLIFSSNLDPLLTRGGQHNNEEGNILPDSEGDLSVTPFSGRTIVTIGEPGEDANMKLQIDSQNIRVSSTLQSTQTGRGHQNSAGDNALSYEESDLTTKHFLGQKIVTNGDPGEDANMKPHIDGQNLMFSSNFETLKAGGERKYITESNVAQNEIISHSDKIPIAINERISISPGMQLPAHYSTRKQEKDSTRRLSKEEVGIQISSEFEILLPQDGRGNIAKDLEGLPKTRKQEQDSNWGPSKEETGVQISSELEALLPQDARTDIARNLEGLPNTSVLGKDLILHVQTEPVRSGASQSVQINIVSSAPEILTNTESELYAGGLRVNVARSSHEWDILKSIVHGGLIESITSVGVVSSAAGGDATTLNILALGLANLVTGLFIIANGLKEIKNEEYEGASNEREKVDRYQDVLGHRRNFRLHATVVVISYLIFGLLPPLTYGFSFRQSDNREYKMIAVASASLFCVFLLAIGKAHVGKPPKSYIKTIMYYLSIGVMASGLSYFAGVLVHRLLERLGWFKASAAAPVPLFLNSASMKQRVWASY